MELLFLCFQYQGMKVTWMTITLDIHSVYTFIRVCFNSRLAIRTESTFVFISNPWHFHHKLFLYMRTLILKYQFYRIRELILTFWLWWGRLSSLCSEAGPGPPLVGGGWGHTALVQPGSGPGSHSHPPWLSALGVPPDPRPTSPVNT